MVVLRIIGKSLNVRRGRYMRGTKGVNGRIQLRLGEANKPPCCNPRKDPRKSCSFLFCLSSRRKFLVFLLISANTLRTKRFVKAKLGLIVLSARLEDYKTKNHEFKSTIQLWG